MPDLDAAIRAMLAGTRSPVAIIETPEPLSPAEFDGLVARFRAAQLRPHEEIKVIPRSLVDRMGDALLAVLDADPTTRQVDAIAKAFGIVVGE
jgi:hypothetical protein